MSVNLIVFKDDGSRRDIPVGPGTYVMGRQEGATIRIPLPSVSRSHCELVVSASGARVRDLGSSNGTYHNYSRVEEAELSPGDVLGVGDCLLTVQIDGAPQEVEKPEPPIGGPSGDSSMMDTPSPVVSGGGGGGASAGAGSDEVGLGAGSLTADLGMDDSGEDGSMFDLDFLDDDDADAPKL